MYTQPWVRAPLDECGWLAAWAWEISKTLRKRTVARGKTSHASAHPGKLTMALQLKGQWPQCREFLLQCGKDKQANEWIKIQVVGRRLEGQVGQN